MTDWYRLARVLRCKTTSLVIRLVKGALQLLINAICKIALFRYLSEFRFQVLTAITSKLNLDLPMKPGTIRNK